jgi:hypothetical protein
MFKILILQQWYGLSDFEVERQMADRISFISFLGFPDPSPDSRTIRLFRECMAISPWAYYVNGWRISDHMSFEEYMKGHDCPFEAEYQQEWKSGKLAISISSLVFNSDYLN